MKKVYSIFDKVIRIGLFILVIFIAVKIFGPNKKRLLKNGDFGTAEITDFHKALNEGVWTRYEYKINSKVYTRNENTGSPLYKNKEMFIGKVFPILYSKENPQVSYILILNRDYEGLGLMRPDSLAWLCDSLGICD